MNTTNGKIAEQSKQKILQGMLRIMEHYDFREITITQVTQEAQLSRRTFYRLFPDKEAVLSFLFCRLSAECMQELEDKQIHHYWDVVQFYFDFCEKQKDLLHLLKKNNLLERFFSESYQYSFTAFTKVRSKETAYAYSALLPYLLAYSVGGMNSMILRWVEEDMQVPSSQLINCLKAGFQSAEL